MRERRLQVGRPGIGSTVRRRSRMSNPWGCPWIIIFVENSSASVCVCVLVLHAIGTISQHGYRREIPSITESCISKQNCPSNMCGQMLAGPRPTNTNLVCDSALFVIHTVE